MFLDSFLIIFLQFLSSTDVWSRFEGKVENRKTSRTNFHLNILLYIAVGLATT